MSGHTQAGKVLLELLAVYTVKCTLYGVLNRHRQHLYSAAASVASRLIDQIPCHDCWIISIPALSRRRLIASLSTTQCLGSDKRLSIYVYMYVYICIYIYIVNAAG